MKFFLAILSCFFWIQIHCSLFSYDDTKNGGPSNWWKTYTACGGIRQSPINIDTNTVLKASYCNPLTIFNLNLPTSSIELVNSGHGASMRMEFPYGLEVHIFGGPLRHSHTLKNFHLHWPGEHTLDGKRYPAELHLVFFNEKYDSFDEASRQSDGLVVLGFFFELDNTLTKKNNYLQLFQHIQMDMRKHEITDQVSMITLYDIVGNKPLSVYSYLGSLTTPACNENVLWMVSTSTLKITQTELNKLNMIKFDTGERIDENFRPVQKLMGRKVMLY